MRILITGATGFIGKNLCERLLDERIDFDCIVRPGSDVKLLDEKNIKHIVFDGDASKLAKDLKKNKYVGIVHLASLFVAKHNEYQIDDLLSSNIGFGTKLLEACKIANIKWFLNTGTFWQHYRSEEYNPVNLYAATKQAFENIARFYTESSDLIFLTLKLNDTFGPNDTRKKIFNLWDEAKDSRTLFPMSPGEQIMDISYIDDVINAYILLIKDLNSKNADLYKNKCFSVNSEERVSLKSLFEIYKDVTKSKLDIAWGALSYREREVMVPWSGAEKVPNWKQSFNLRKAIKETVNINDLGE